MGSARIAGTLAIVFCSVACGSRSGGDDGGLTGDSVCVGEGLSFVLGGEVTNKSAETFTIDIRLMGEFPLTLFGEQDDGREALLRLYFSDGASGIAFNFFVHVGTLADAAGRTYAIKGVQDENDLVEGEAAVTSLGHPYRPNEEQYRVGPATGGEVVIHSAEVKEDGRIHLEFALDYPANGSAEGPGRLEGCILGTVTSTGLDPQYSTVSVSFDGDGVGRVVSDPPGIDCPGNCEADFERGMNVTLTASPGARSTFAGWTDWGDCSGTGPCTFLVGSARREEKASFNQPNPIWFCEEPITGATYTSVMSRILIPMNSVEAGMYGQDIDLDGTSGDNALGRLFSWLKTVIDCSSPNLDFQPAADFAVTNGTALNLLALQTDSLTSDPAPTARVDLFWGSSSGPPDLSGSGMFGASELSDMSFCGGVGTAGFQGYAGEREVRLLISILGVVVYLPLQGAVISLDTTGGCISGRIGGGVTQADLDTVVLSRIVGAYNSEIATAGSCADRVRGTFDTDNSGTISLSELKNSPVLAGLLDNDVDLFAGGFYDPGVDGTLDHLSIGFAFDCVGASFALP